MRFPQNYAHKGDLPRRHAEEFLFSVIYPSMASTLDPGMKDEMKKNLGWGPDEQISFSIRKPRDSYDGEVSRFFSYIYREKQYRKGVKFEYLPIPPGFIDQARFGRQCGWNQENRPAGKN